MTMCQMLLSASTGSATNEDCNGDEPVLNENTSEPDVSDVENLFSTTEQADTATSEDGELTVNEKFTDETYDSTSEPDIFDVESLSLSVECESEIDSVSNDVDGSDDGDELVSEGQQKLYSGSQISSQDCSVALLSIMHKHSLTYAAVSDILKLFSNSLPSPNSFPHTQDQLLKNVVTFYEDTVVHRCCTGFLPSDSICSNAECQGANIPDSTFVEVCIEHVQLKT